MSLYTEFAQKNVKELNGLLAEGRGHLHELAFQQTIGQLKSVREITETRKRIARILTALRAQA